VSNIVTQTQEVGTWYRRPVTLCRHVAALLRTTAQSGSHNTEVKVLFIKSTTSKLKPAFEQGDDVAEENVGIVVGIKHVTDDNFSYWTYEWWGNERWNYWRSRQYCKAIMLFCNHIDHHKGFDLYYDGVNLDESIMARLQEGLIMPAEALATKHWRHGAWWIRAYTLSDNPQADETSEYAAVLALYDRMPLDALITNAAVFLEEETP